MAREAAMRRGRERSSQSVSIGIECGAGGPFLFRLPDQTAHQFWRSECRDIKAAHADVATIVHEVVAVLHDVAFFIAPVDTILREEVLQRREDLQASR